MTGNTDCLKSEHTEGAQLSKRLSPRAFLADALVHCTTLECFKAIRQDGAIKPNVGNRPFQNGVSNASRCFKLGAISLFDTAAEPKRNWLWQWLTGYKPITVAIRIAPERVDRDKCLSCSESRKLASGVMVPGEICYRGEIPLEWVSGFLLVWANDIAIHTFIPGNTLTDEQITEFQNHAHLMTTPKLPISKIVSGGQTGADRAALDWAIKNNIPHGGWCPKGRRSEDGTVPECYNLQELDQKSYLARTERNVIDADGTLIVTLKAQLSGGSKRTAEFARKHGKPFLHIHSDIRSPGASLRRFLSEHPIAVLNVAGPRASTEPDIGEFMMEVLDETRDRRESDRTGTQAN